MKGSGRGGPPSDRVLTVPNALTLARLLAIPVVLILLLEEKDISAATVFVVAALTDFLDGRIARRRGGPSTLGVILDPLADRLMLSSVAVVLAVRDLLPASFVAVLVGRDALTLLGSWAFQGKIKVNKVGKVATAVLMASVAVIMYRPGIIGEAMFYAGLGLSLVAGALYVRTVRKLFGRDGGGVR